MRWYSAPQFLHLTVAIPRICACAHNISSVDGCHINDKHLAGLQSTWFRRSIEANPNYPVRAGTDSTNPGTTAAGQKPSKTSAFAPSAASRAAAGNGIFAAGDRRPKTCLREETYAQRRKSRPHDREKPAENRLFRRLVFHGEFRWTGWWAYQGSNLGPIN